MDKILRNAAGEIRLELRDEAGVLVNADSPPSVVVFDGAGVEILASAVAGTAGTGIYTRAIPSNKTAVLDRYEAVWTVVKSGQTNIFTTYYEVVGGLYFSIGEARFYDGGALSNTTTYPTQTLVDAREAIENEIEELALVAFVPRGRRVVLDGLSTELLLLPNRAVRSVVGGTRDGVALTSTELDALRLYADEGQLWSSSGWGYGVRTLALHYEYGYDEVPARIKTLALSMLVRRLTSVTSAAGVKSESIGSYDVTYNDGVMDMTDAELNVINYYRTPVLG